MPISPLRFLLPWLPLVLAGGAVALAAQEDSRTLHWRELAVEARLDAEGRLHVRERHAMVFDGAWNGGEREFDLRLGQELRFESLTRVDPETGARTRLRRGDLAEIDEFDWTDGETLRWRSRLAADPPFRMREIVYDLAYTLWPVLTREGDGYLLRHDFAFPDRAGVIEDFRVDLVLDPAWAGPARGRLSERAELLPPGRGYTLRLPLRHVGSGAPDAVPEGAPSWVRAAVAVGALLVPLGALVVLYRRSRELDRIAPPVGIEEIGEPWLRHHIFTYPAEVVGAAWDRSVGEAEVAALLARWVAEGRLGSRVEAGDASRPVLHLHRVAPRDAFAEHERALVDALFFDGTDRTDTESIRAHYEKAGFDPASHIRAALLAGLEELPGTGRRKRPWIPALLALLAGLVPLALAATGAAGSGVVAALGLLVAVLATVPVLLCASALAWRVGRQGGLIAGVVGPLLVLAALLAGVAFGVLETVFFRPGTLLLAGLLWVLAGLGLLALALSRSAETTERIAFRRRMASAREYFAAELRRPAPRLRDEWFPYLLALGLGPHVDRWFRAFGGRSGTGVAGPAILSAGAAAGQSSTGVPPAGAWTGGGPQFGGGSGGGGGAGRTWGVAVAGIASGVAAPGPSGGGGGGVSVSGGGGGGGW